MHLSYAVQPCKGIIYFIEVTLSLLKMSNQIERFLVSYLLSSSAFFITISTIICSMHCSATIFTRLCCRTTQLFFSQKSRKKTPSNSATLRYYLTLRYYCILTCHYELLCNIIRSLQTITIYRYLLLYPRTLFYSDNKHARPETYTVSLIDNIQNIDHLMAVHVHHLLSLT